MRWRDARRSDNVEDRRSSGFGRGGGIRLGGGGLGLGGLLLLLGFAYVMGVNPLSLLDDVSMAPDDTALTSGSSGGGSDEASEFAARVLGDLEDTWGTLFQRMGRTYDPPRLVLFSDVVRSACGTSSSAVGPFYCPGDEQVYLDLSFFRELDQRFGAPGDFAQAYVIAHEVGHHVQHLLGIDRRAAAMVRGAGEAEANAVSVRQELQADCFAGVWGHYAANRLLEPGDAEEGLRAAAAIGDDRLQGLGRGEVAPETFTHGSSAQRVEWLHRGMDTGSVDACDTF
jgi:predicted metalloprotease